MLRPIHFKKWNTGTGWFVFSFAFIVYLLTLEPTASFWDCGEFLSCAFHLEVSHAPGAPLFMLLGRIASLVYPSHPTILINGLSALASAFTILFLFWTITWLGRKLMKEWEISNSKKLIILIAGAIGSLAYAYSDSFWFSAVEAEVYGLSSALTALVFWCILKWEAEFDRSERADRWLILIAYIFGLSVGVHLLNLLAIPAIVFVYFFKKYPFNGITVLKSLGFSLLLLFVFLVIILKWIPHFLSISELFCVNNLGLPFNSGFIAGVLIVFVIPVLSYHYFTKKKMNSYAHWSICLLFVLIGISCYGVIVIRSNDNPPIDMTKERLPNDYMLGNITQLYFRIGNSWKGKELFEKVKNLCRDNLSYFIGLKSEGKFVSEYEISLNMYLLHILGKTAQKYNLTEFSEEIKVMWNNAARQLT